MRQILLMVVSILCLAEPAVFGAELRRQAPWGTDSISVPFFHYPTQPYSGVALKPIWDDGDRGREYAAAFYYVFLVNYLPPNAAPGKYPRGGTYEVSCAGDQIDDGNLLLFISAGTYTISIKSVVWNNNLYDRGSSNSTSFRIDQIVPRISLTNLQQKCDGNGKAVTVDAVGGDGLSPIPRSAVTVLYDGLPALPTAVGEYDVLAFVDYANYSRVLPAI